MTQEEIWNSRWQAVKDFIVANKRNPSKHDPEERGLYLNWLKHNKKLYNSGEMKQERKGKFEELLVLMEKYKHKNQYE